MKLSVFVVLLIGLVRIPASAEEAPTASQLICKAGPLAKTYGATDWLVYGCNDGHSVVFVSAPGSRANPFVFMLHYETNGTYQLSGEGTGEKAMTEAAFREISTLTRADIDALLTATKTK
jgi:hypothetical protein